MAGVTGWGIAPEEEIGVVEPSTPEELRADLESAHNVLRKIARLNVANFTGGPNNRHFGKKFITAFGRAQQLAKEEMVDQITREANREHRIHEEEESNAEEA